jgi:hypothetical protein
MPASFFLKAEPGRFSDVMFPDRRTRLWEGAPSHLQQRLICCDCGLSHDYEFVVVETVIHRGKVTMVRVAPKRFAIQWRGRRNERSTARNRRARKYRCKPKTRKR